MCAVLNPQIRRTLETGARGNATKATHVAWNRASMYQALLTVEQTSVC